ncbi:hypothetical protein [Sediminibacterium sp.]|uniref:hypothetical protein n=1 Tax=Sediminibacterium sp. TaxID=1917865 RepID=UPI00273628B8|nr:hypothetical protein [Sediminibacterium sp.]MDP3567386.1 hypothetical protein [Sediminibacterium sp.]
MEEKNFVRHQLAIITFFSLIPHFGIIFYFFSLMPSGNDWGGGMSNFIYGIQFFILAFAFTAMIPLLYKLLLPQFQNNKEWLAVIIVFILALSCVVSYFCCYSIVYPTGNVLKEILNK